MAEFFRKNHYGRNHGRAAANREIDGLTMMEWEALALSILTLPGEWENCDDPAAILRAVKCDARIRDKGKIKMSHMNLAQQLLRMGGRDQARRAAQ